MDRQTGDIIRVRGNGAIKMRVDTRGDFTMAGLYNITEGSYRFTFSNFINKDFTILPNSTITWSGDPAAAQLDINAAYNQYVSITPLLVGFELKGTDSAQRYAEASRRYPANVKMHLTGAMLNPQIGLSLDVPNNYPSSLGTYVTSFLAAVQNNEQELNKQVFSLMLLKSFSPIGSNVYAGASSTVGNFSELLANQLSSWLSDVNKNLEVGVNLNGFDTRALENLQLRLSYTLLDGRLRITRNGNFTNTQNSATAASVAGDWTVEYLLTRDGKLRAKMFHRTNQTLANAGIGLGNQYYTTSQGVSLMHTQSFDKLGELFPQWLYKRKKRREEREGTKPTESEPIILPLARPSVSAK